MGMMTQASGKRIYYLARGDRAYAVGDGAKIDDTYRVNGLRGKKLSITYLPDGVEQVLPMAGPTESDANGGKEAADAPTYIPDPHAVVEAPQPPAPAPEIVQAPGNFARPRRPVPGGGMAPGAAPVAAVPDKAPVAAQVPEGLSFEPPPAFNMEKSQEFSIGTEADKDRAASQQDEN